MTAREFYGEIGQNYDVVLGRMMGSEEFVKMLLGEFLKDHTMEHLKTAVEHGETEEIFNQSHTLKGLALNLGIKPLYQETEVLVEMTRAGQPSDGVAAVFSKIESTYRKMTALLQTVELTKGSGNVV